MIYLDLQEILLITPGVLAGVTSVNQSVDKYLAKEVQATLPLTFYIYIFDEIDSRYHKYFRADLFTAPPQVYTYRLTNTSYNFAMISTFPNQNEILGIPHINCFGNGGQEEDQTRNCSSASSGKYHID